MLKIHLTSDHHVDIRGNEMTDADRVRPDCNLVVGAGDFRAPGTLALREFYEMYAYLEVPLVYTAGNHDFYSEHSKHHPELKTTWERQLEEMPRVAEQLGIVLLQDSAHKLDIEGMPVRLLGGTLWSDFEARPGWVGMNEALRSAEKAMNDYRLIKTGAGRSKDMLRTRQTIDAHRATVRFLEQALCTPFDGDTIVVTHHSPSYQSLRKWDPEHPERFSNMDWCYASNLEHLMTGIRPNGEPMPTTWGAPSLWLHGHVHANQDYVVGQTRICSNPRGYPMFALGMTGRENPNYDPGKVIKLEPRYAPTMGMR
ncbi:MAG: metallophosphoesterase [Hyphomicrobiales bacterium]|jgi:hypothetical protein|nr:metallophosphoesterase [Hyphomicrobiales bacterium]